MGKHQSTSLGQTNKPFKGSSKHHKSNFKLGLETTKKIQKQEKPVSKNERKSVKIQQRLQKLNMEKEQLDRLLNVNKNLDDVNREYLKNMLCESVAPKVVALLQMNQIADCNQILQSLQQTFGNVILQQNLPNLPLEFNFPYLSFQTDPKTHPELGKDSYVFVLCPRDIETTMDVCKVADLVIPILSCKLCEVNQINQNPFDKANAFDELGYKTLTFLRLQGLASMMCVLQDLEQIPIKKKQNVKNLYQRFFESELGDQKFFSFENNNIIQFMRQLEGISLQKMEWRDQRGYMLCQNVIQNQNQNQVMITGFWKGQGYSANQLIHITGLGDYQVAKVEILQNPFKAQRKPKVMINDSKIIDENSNVMLEQYSDEKCESLEAFFKGNDSLTQASQFKKILENDEDDIMMDEGDGMNQQQMEDGDMENEEEFNDDDSGDYNFNEQTGVLTDIEEERKKLYSLRQRTEDELEFEDEIDYPAYTDVIQRFRKYVGLKSFKSSQWVVMNDLPDEYEKIFTFDNFIRSQKRSLKNAKENAFAFGGCLVRLTVKNLDLSNHNPSKPLVISSLLQYEHKMTQVHFKINKNKELQGKKLLSKQNYEIQMGFRRFNSNLIFSKHFNNTQKSKYDKYLRDNQTYLASCYHYASFPPASVIIFKNSNEIETDSMNDLLNSEKIMVASGELYKNDPMQIILKRAILTGYPHKIFKRKASVRYMFFSQKEIKYFQPIELSTKLGLRGKIKESIGTHGHMKCTFNNNVKPHDVICLNLYKRVFPKWNY